MSNAVIVDEVYKKFGKPSDPFWKRVLLGGHSLPNPKNAGTKGIEDGKASPESTPGKNGSNGNGTHPASPISNSHKNGSQKITIAVDHISFAVAESEIFGVLGPNGGGKSTLIRLISTLLIPDSGKITVFGYDVERQPMKVQQCINRVSVEASFFKKLSPMENLMYGARLYGLDSGKIRKDVVDLLTRLGIEKRSIYNPMEEMSRGMQQKVAIARAVISKPRLLLLDEPTTGLDPRSKREVQDMVREMRAAGTTILLTTHDMLEADTLCDRIAIMDSGKVMALDTPPALKMRLPLKDGKETTLEDVFLELTGKKLKKEDEEEENHD